MEIFFKTRADRFVLGALWLVVTLTAHANGSSRPGDSLTAQAQTGRTHNTPDSTPDSTLNEADGTDGEVIFRLVAEAVLRNDPSWRVGQNKARQFKHLATAKSALPNPVFTTGLFNVPFDGLSLTENPTTQWRFGLKQAIPRGKTRQLLKAHSLATASSFAFDSQADFLQRVRKTQRLWLDLYFLQHKKRIITENRQLLSELIKLAENKLAEGRAQQQDVIQARLEWLRLKDELIRVTEEVAAKEAEYHSIAGHGDPSWPDLPAQAEELKIAPQNFAQHPAVQRHDASIRAAEEAIGLAREKKKPQWLLGGEYRKRFGTDTNGIERNDLFALTASIDLPFARRRATDAEVAAALAARNAAEDRRQAQWLELQAELGRARSGWLQSKQASELYNHRLLAEARLNVQAAEDAYSAGTGDFTAVILAQKNLLKTQLAAIRWQVRQWQSWVSLSYLQGRWLSVLESSQPDSTTGDQATTAHQDGHEPTGTAQ